MTLAKIANRLLYEINKMEFPHRLRKNYYNRNLNREYQRRE